MENYGTEIPSKGVQGERALWTAVITQSLMDASSKSKKMEMKYEKSQALCWLMTAGEDFREVCYNANLDPSCIREKSIEALKRDCKWRVESSKVPKDSKAADVAIEDVAKEISKCNQLEEV